MMSQKPISGSSSQLKAEINDLTSARVNIEKGKQISDSMIKLTKTLTNMKPLLKNQQGYIKNFFAHQQSTSPENKESENRRTINRICQCAINDINEMLDVSSQYFTLDFKNNWNKIKNNFEKQFNAAREQIDQKNLVDFLFKIINVKDYFTTLFMKSFLYRKIVLWKDLNITQAGYIHAEIKSIVKLIEQQIMHKGYVPTKPVFDWMGMNIKGKWSMNKLDATEFDLKTMVKLTNQSIQNVFSVLRNFASLNIQQRLHQDIDRNKEKVKSLREEIQQSKINYMNLQKKYRQAVLKDQKSDLVELREKVSELEEQLQAKENELKRIKFQFRDSSNQINTLKQKIKELESDLNRITNQQLKKLKELETVQYSLNDQFVKIYKNINNFGSMFEFESEGKKSLAREIQAKQKTIEKMVEVLGKQKKKTREQGEEIVRLNEIILELGNKLRRT